jgi:hypothetical protein
MHPTFSVLNFRFYPTRQSIILLYKTTHSREKDFRNLFYFPSEPKKSLRGERKDEVKSLCYAERILFMQ